MLFWILIVLWLIVPFLGWRYRSVFGSDVAATFWAFGLTLLIGSIIYVLHIWAAEWELRRAWDPDGNGQLDIPTPEASEAMREWASDTGRYIAAYFSIPVTLLWGGFIFAILAVATGIRQKLFPKNAK